MNNREMNILQSLRMSGPRLVIWMVSLVAVILWGLFAYSRQFRFGLIETGMRDQISWGLYISNFVFFIGISHAGTLISAILRVTEADWRRPITRMAEGITVVALCIGGCMVLVDLGRPERALNLLRYGRIQSPIIWDVLGVTTYLTGSLLYFYLPLLPDLAIVASAPGISGVRRRLYRLLSLGWTGSAPEWHLLEKAIAVMAVAIIPLAVSVHTVVSWIFAMTLRPGWNSSIFGPYFVVGAIYSGAAAVILAMCIMRRVMRLEAYLEPVHFRNLGLLLISFSLLYLYFNINEYLTVSYKFQGEDKLLIERLFHGDYSPYFWTVQVIGVALPTLLMAAVLGPKRYREYTIPGLGLASFLAIAGAWAKRYLIVVPTLSSPFLPIQRLPQSWGHYTPSWVEWSITAGAFAAFLLLYTLLSKLFPVVSIWETRSDEKTFEVAQAQTAFGSSAWGVAAPLPLLLICAAIVAAPAARAQSAAKGKPAVSQPTSLSLDWKTLPAAKIPQLEDARISQPPAAPERTYFFSRVSPFSWNSESKKSVRERDYPAVAVTAQLRDAQGQALTFQAVKFTLKTSLGSLDLGTYPTNAEGRTQVIMRDRRAGRYAVSVAYRGDDTHAESRSEVMVDFGPRPAPALPGDGVLISPTFSPAIGIPFLFFYGTMWVVFVYAFGYLVLWRMRRTRVKELAASTDA